MLAGFPFVVAFICVVDVNACSLEMNPREPKVGKRITSLLKSGLDETKHASLWMFWCFVHLFFFFFLEDQTALKVCLWLHVLFFFPPPDISTATPKPQNSPRTSLLLASAVPALIYWDFIAIVLASQTVECSLFACACAVFESNSVQTV